MKRIVIFIILLVLATPLIAAETKREQIGEALGNPIYRDQIDESRDLYGQLQNLFRMPFQKKYLESHKNELEVKDWEIEYVVRYFEKKHNEDLRNKDSELNQRLALTKKQVEEIEAKLSNKDLSASEREALEMEKNFWQTMLKPPGKDFAKFLLSGWKYYRLLYDNYGGGRVIWEQEGLVAFDAMLKWLKYHEKQGDFKITDLAS
ncbi:MAG TPA: hypothetical protein VEI46_11530 [Thermodesulfovibrionales bacterium]|nr:hypothetical protein [Thermodesulfovibrionales bacterium]